MYTYIYIYRYNHISIYIYIYPLNSLTCRCDDATKGPMEKKQNIIYTCIDVKDVRKYFGGVVQG